jgi:hypothetical protein
LIGTYERAMQFQHLKIQWTDVTAQFLISIHEEQHVSVSVVNSSSAGARQRFRRASRLTVVGSTRSPIRPRVAVRVPVRRPWQGGQGPDHRPITVELFQDPATNGQQQCPAISRPIRRPRSVRDTRTESPRLCLCNDIRPIRRDGCLPISKSPQDCRHHTAQRGPSRKRAPTAGFATAADQGPIGWDSVASTDVRWRSA